MKSHTLLWQRWLQHYPFPLETQIDMVNSTVSVWNSSLGTSCSEHQISRYRRSTQMMVKWQNIIEYIYLSTSIVTLKRHWNFIWRHILDSVKLFLWFESLQAKQRIGRGGGTTTGGLPGVICLETLHPCRLQTQTIIISRPRRLSSFEEYQRNALIFPNTPGEYTTSLKPLPTHRS